MAGSNAFNANWTGEVLSPDEILYYLDGPAIFLKSVGPFTFLFVKADEKDECDFYIASQIASKQVRYLKSGKLSVRGALLSGNLWVFELDLDLTVLRHEEVSESEIESFLPQQGIALRADFGVVPDSVQQSEASYAFKFFGDEMSEKGMPFSTFKGLVDDVYSTLRKVLTPPSLGHGKSTGVLDFPVRQPEFASLVIAVDAPEIDLARFKRGKKTKDLDANEVLAESEVLGVDFAQHLKRTVDVMGAHGLPDKYASDNLDFLLTLVDILPSQRGDVKRMQFSTNGRGKTDVFVDVDLLTAEKIRASVREVEDQEARVHGFISGILEGSNSLRIKTIYKREITCKLSAEIFDEILGEGKLVIGKPVIVEGLFTKRQLRDFMKVEVRPTFP
ncbi:hypothetical protein [Altererythrobacter aquiaggeris]|uniref:hypothetical protein n=1 Tax=Aestuarierythrobacter aquiaggeris TaxID=1898396 RepID=UPI00301B2E79